MEVFTIWLSSILKYGRPLQKEWRRWIEKLFSSSSLLRIGNLSWRLENVMASELPLKPFRIGPIKKMALWFLEEKKEPSFMIMWWLQKGPSRWLWRERLLLWMGGRLSGRQTRCE